MSMHSGVQFTGFLDDSQTRLYLFSMFPHLVGYREDTKESVIMRRCVQLSGGNAILFEHLGKEHIFRLDPEPVLDLTTIADDVSWGVTNMSQGIDYETPKLEGVLNPVVLIVPKCK